MVSTHQIREHRRFHRNEVSAHTKVVNSAKSPAPLQRKRTSTSKTKRPVKASPIEPIEVVDCVSNTAIESAVSKQPKKAALVKSPATFSVSISVVYKQYIIHQYAGMHQVDTYNFAAYMTTESTKVNDWATRKKLNLIRRCGKATIACDLRGSCALTTLVDGPEDYKSAEGIADAWGSVEKKGVRIVIEIIYDLEDQEDEEESSDSDREMSQPKKARKVRSTESQFDYIG